MKKIVLASGNKGKIAELNALLADLNIEVIPQTTLGVSDADETGLTFVENALIKARHAAAVTGLPAIADDSGLCVDVLQGAPGIYSARYAGVPSDDAKNNQKLLEALKYFRSQAIKAQFVCVLVLVRYAEDPLPIICEGLWQGEILEVPQGENGFGYDPLFWVPSEGLASAQLSKERKNTVSHRAQALRLLKQRLGV
jgi:XTP/dITP diphosphohydrolase